ncbi:MAG: hypothetical protein QOI98_3453 [Solirubrobacteraceae bacterium]|nr:hypothetical protein [Solirubrobacteraceae bacterium]
MSETLTVLTPVAAGRTRDLKEAVKRLPPGAESPVARVVGTHVARFTVVEALDDRNLEPDPEPGSFLLFSTDIDGTTAECVERLRTGLGQWADRIWGHCESYPGVRRARPFGDWLLRHRVPIGFSVAPYAGASVADVRHALSLKRRLVGFALEAPRLEAAELKRAWLREFGDGRSVP